MRPTWIRTFHRSAAPARRLLCFPYAGGSASYYFPLSAVLCPAVQVLGVQYPGRQDRAAEPAIEDLGVLADRIAEAVAGDIEGARPVLFGHSMGALLAFETARRLEEKYAAPPAGLIVSGMVPPDRRPALRLGTEDEIVEELRLLRGIDPALLADPELRALVLPALRSDWRAVASYAPDTHAVLSCPITVLTGRDDALVDPDAAAGWAARTTADFSLRTFPGGHFYLDGFPPEITAAVKAATFLA
ncbi:thioesterase II family protein [Streptomyces violens]|uniref:thioesterase II family protein n=1 Tax=Streptomyces violens TaxID=66377 RepID=UPI0004BECFDE|nr:alpha/beta fold hydrolase [Streptomyces violens]